MKIMTRRLLATAAAPFALLLTVAACSAGASDNVAAGKLPAATPPVSAPPAGFPCTEYPSLGTVTPVDLPLPTAEQLSGSATYVTGSVTGPTSFFGGPAGGAPGPFALTQQWDPDGWHQNPGVPYGMEIGTTPCDDTAGSDNYRSYFAAMRFSPREDSPKATAYQEYAKYSTDPSYAKWNGGPLVSTMAEPLSYLYGRKLQVSRTENGVKRTVIVRAVDRGPTEGAPWGKRPVDLSPWAMGALTGIPACLDWDGSNTGLLQELCDFTGNESTNVVTVSWADNSLPLGPLSAGR